MFDITENAPAPNENTVDTTLAPEGNISDAAPEGSDSGSDPEPFSGDQPAENDKPSKREAKYRVQLRETEAERDQLTAKVEALQRAEVERLAAKVIQKPGALWAAQTPLNDLLADDGTVDPQKVAAAAKSAQETLGLAATRSGPYVAREGMSLQEPGGGGNAWENAFKV